ncbi:hypothetical protein [Bradyrhizobium viridifuturi]|uniref:hypothetical protein n=1 Tax=Bradyrhizobium viridifuturi TaxID=1654716 RepID=UPI00067ED677|nr:hypothetical protein [Bradyrhizobium viridifuturi]
MDPETLKVGAIAINLVVEAFKALKAILPKAEEYDRRLQKDVVVAIRSLYFTPRGILSLLRQVVDGEELSHKRIQQALNDFNDREWEIARTLVRIERTRLHGELGLSLSTLRALDVLSSGKAGLRHAVQEEVNLYGQHGVKPNKGAAKRLMTAIEKLNAQIEDIDGVVNNRARSGPPRKPPATKRGKAAKKPAPKKARKALSP